MIISAEKLIDKTTLTGKRDDALFELVYSCGLRISEVCTLKVANVHLDDRLILVHGKGNKERLVPVRLFCVVQRSISPNVEEYIRNCNFHSSFGDFS